MLLRDWECVCVIWKICLEKKLMKLKIEWSEKQKQNNSKRILNGKKCWD